MAVFYIIPVMCKASSIMLPAHGSAVGALHPCQHNEYYANQVRYRVALFLPTFLKDVGILAAARKGKVYQCLAALKQLCLLPFSCAAHPSSSRATRLSNTIKRLRVQCRRPTASNRHDNKRAPTYSPVGVLVAVTSRHYEGRAWVGWIRKSCVLRTSARTGDVTEIRHVRSERPLSLVRLCDYPSAGSGHRLTA